MHMILIDMKFYNSNGVKLFSRIKYSTYTIFRIRMKRFNTIILKIVANLMSNEPWFFSLTPNAEFLQNRPLKNDKKKKKKTNKKNCWGFFPFVFCVKCTLVNWTQLYPM